MIIKTHTPLPMLVGSMLASLLCAALAAGPARAQAPTVTSKSQRELWNTPASGFRIIGNIYYVGTEGLGMYLIASPQGHVLIDGGLPESATLVEANIESLGFKLRDVKYLLNSHAHSDHAGGLARLKKDTGATMVASEGDRSALEGGFYLGWEDRHQYDFPPVKVDQVIADGEKVRIGGNELTANITAGHTRGCTSWSMPVEEAGRTYEVLFFCSASVAGNRLADPPQYPGIVADYEKTFARARNMQVDVFLAAHTEFFGMRDKRARMKEGGPNPFIDPDEFAPFIARWEAAFRQKLERIEKR